MVSPYLRRRLRTLEEIAAQGAEEGSPLSAEAPALRRRAAAPAQTHVAETENAERRGLAASPLVAGR